MNIVFVGASSFGLKCLEACLKIKGISILGVITAPAKFRISYSSTDVNNVLHTDFRDVSSQYGLEIVSLETNMLDPHLLEKVNTWRPDAFVIVGWYHMVPKAWREIAPCFGLHASLLPKYSGGAPLVWAIINGEKSTGISLFQMDENVDTGPIVGQKELVITVDDTIKTLYSRVEKLGVELLEENLPKLASGTAELRPQDQSNRIVWPQRAPKDGLINWNKSASEVYDFIRAQTEPYPGAFFYFKENKITVWAAKICTHEGEIGELSIKDDKILVFCNGKSSIELTNISVNDKKITKCEFIRDYYE